MRKQTYNPRAALLWMLVLAFFWAAPVWAGKTYQPFVLAAPAGGTVEEATANVVGKLKTAGFEVAGQYDPYGDGSVTIIGVTDPALRKAAAGHSYGGFGAVVRVAVTNNNGTIEVSYVNPDYMGYAYHIGDLSSVTQALGKALGGGKGFGGEGMTAKDLGKYHYMMMMPYFEDQKVVANFSSNAKAVDKIGKALANPKAHMRAVWQVRINDKQTLFGVQLYGGEWKGQIKATMEIIDTGTPKSTAALPWEVLITDGDVAYLPGRYRIAIMFPELTMGTFMKISEVPDRMDETIEHLADLAE